LRILPERVDNHSPEEDPNRGDIAIANRAPGARSVFPAKDVVDAGFLELVRHGVRKADDPIIVDSLKVVDAVLKVDTPFGPCWRRYNHDGYGQRDDGGPFVGWGRGRAWPLLTGERGHYELAAGHDVKPFVRAMESLASATGLLPEQAWDGPDQPKVYMYCGRPTGSAMPLMWAHAEYIKLLRSVHDGKVSDLIDDVAKRYLGERANRRLFEVWKFTRQVRSVKPGYVLRIQAQASFRLHWSDDEWHTVKDTPSSTTALEVAFVDIPILAPQRTIRFTFFWTASESWEGRDFLVSVP
jgi:glucoamylase